MINPTTDLNTRSVDPGEVQPLKYIVDPSGCFPEGPDPPILLLSISEWIKSRGPSLAFVNQRFLLTLKLDKGTNTLEHFGRSKMIKGQAPQIKFKGPTFQR